MLERLLWLPGQRRLSDSFISGLWTYIRRVRMADRNKPIIIGADHNGLLLKNVVRDYLRCLGFNVVDIGVKDDTPVDYPMLALH